MVVSGVDGLKQENLFEFGTDVEVRVDIEDPLL
jgi:hypothetical protein